jgi:hypothetical protein
VTGDEPFAFAVKVRVKKTPLPVGPPAACGSLLGALAIMKTPVSPIDPAVLSIAPRGKTMVDPPCAAAQSL